MGFYIGNIEINNIYVGGTEIVSAYVGSSQIYGGVSDAVTFTAKQANSTIGLSQISTGQTLEYSTDKTIWNNMTTATTITLTNSGDSVYVRGILTSNNTNSNYTQFTMSGDIKATGNINYLWNKDTPYTALKEYCGYRLFSGCTALTEVINLSLPATTLAYSCYRGMFQDCTSLTTAPVLPATTLASQCYAYMFTNCSGLTTAPELPATTLANNCYEGMFEGCTSLTTAPELPATTLAVGCYESMFRNCTSITVAPQLPATTLVNSCYAYMFSGCTNLNYIKCLATDISATDCTSNWVDGVASTGTFVKDPSMTGWTTGTSGIPSGWTVQDDRLRWTPTPSGLLSSSGVTYSGSTWTFGTDADGDYYTNNGAGEIIPLGYLIDGTERFRIKFKYDHTDGRQLLGNSFGYNDGQFTYRLFLYEGQTFDMGDVGGGANRISTQVYSENVLLDYEIGNYYIKDYNGSVIVQGTPNQYVAPQDNMLYVGTDGDSTIKIYQIEILT